MVATPTAVLTACGLLLAGVGANEMTHGGLAETMGLGHHHAFDHGGYHCAAPGDDHWARHEQHVHNETHAPAGHCGGHHGHRGGADGPGGMGWT